MKLFRSLILVLLCVTISFSAPAIHSPVNDPVPSKTPTLHQLAWMSMKDAQKMAGRKFSFKEKIGFKLLQVKLKKEIKHPAAAKGSGKAKAALWLSIFSLAALLFPFVSIPLAILAIIFGKKALKESIGENKKARTAITLASLSIAITIVAALIFVVFISDGKFGIFIIN